MQTAQSPEQQRSLFSRYKRVLIVVGSWLLVICGIQLFAHNRTLDPLALFQDMVMLCHDYWFGPLLFIGTAALSPFFLIPAALLGSVAGLAFGPVLGIIYTLIGCNISATLTYTFGRYSGHDFESSPRFQKLQERYGKRLRKNSFWTIIILRLTFLPYDPVNYLIGVSGIGWREFIVANTVGSLPGVIAIVLAGASVEHFDGGLPQVNPAILAVSAVLLAVSFGLAYALKRRHASH